MTALWSVVVDDGLDRAADTAAFLQSFCPPGADPVWSADYLRWKLGEANPAGTGFCTLAVHDGRVVGSTTLTPKRLWLGDRVEVGAEIGDTYTDPAFRRGGAAAVPFAGDAGGGGYLDRSVFGRLVTETRARAEANGIRLIYGTPNGNSLPGYCGRLGFFELASHHTENLLRPTARGLGTKFPALRPWTGLLVPLDRLYALLGEGIARCRAAGLTIAPFDGADDEVDALWNRARAGMEFSLVRDGAWYRYRYREHPLNRYALLAVRREGLLRALIVTRRFITMQGRPYLYVADWLFDRDDARAFGRALANAVRAAVGDEVDGVLLWAERESIAAAAARATGFLSRGKSPVIFADCAEAKTLARRAPRLDFTIGSSDNV